MTRDAPAVLVTGAVRRIGAAIAHAFANAGWHVVVHHRHDTPEAEALCRSLPSAEPYACELTDPVAVAAMVDDCAARLSRWQALVCSAAVFERDEADAIDDEVFTRAMATNAAAPVHLVQGYLAAACSPVGRRAILLTDQKLANPNPDFFSYTMSKHALAGAATMLAMAARPGDRVYALAPGAILASHDQSEDETEVSHRLNLLGRKTAASEIAEAALFLAAGSLASGETLYVDSGQHLLAQSRDVIFLAREGAAA